MGQRLNLPRLQAFAFRLQLHLQGIGQRQIHVVAAEQDVVADRDAVQQQVAVLFGHGNQRQVGRAAADIHHEDDIARFDLLAPASFTALYPAVQSGLGLFQQHRLPQPHGMRGLHGQFACRGIEGGRDSDDEFLFTQRRLGETRIPGITQMPQIEPGGFQRRHARHLFRSLDRQDCGPAVDAAVAEPTLRARNQADRRLASKGSCQLADDGPIIVTPGQFQIFGPHFGLVRLVQKGR